MKRLHRGKSIKDRFVDVKYQVLRDLEAIKAFESSNVRKEREHASLTNRNRGFNRNQKPHSERKKLEGNFTMDGVSDYYIGRE